MAKLRKEFNRYIDQLDTIFPEVRGGLRQGLKTTQNLMSAEFPQNILPKELVELYMIADGQNEDAFEEFIPGYRFMPFSEALKTYPRLRKNGIGSWARFPIFFGENQEISASIQSQHPSESQRKLLPKFQKWRTTSLWSTDFEDPDEEAPVSDSIALYFKTLNEAIKQEIVQVMNQGTENAYSEVDDEAFYALSRKLNDGVEYWHNRPWKREMP